MGLRDKYAIVGIIPVSRPKNTSLYLNHYKGIFAMIFRATGNISYLPYKSSVSKSGLNRLLFQVRGKRYEACHRIDSLMPFHQKFASLA